MISIVDNNLKQIIKNINNNPFEEINNLSIEMLEKLILYSADKYYNSDTPSFSDAIYDIMFCAQL